MLEEDNKGIVEVYEDKILTKIKETNDNQMLQIKEAINLAKNRKKNNSREPICLGKKKLNTGGRGLLSILLLGWDLALPKSQDRTLIIEAQKL